MYEVIVDGQNLNDLIYFTNVERTMGPTVKNRIITVTGYIIHDVMETIDVLNKMLTGKIQRFIFTDQPDRYWLGKVLENITPSSSEQWSKIEIKISIPDGVSYAVTLTELHFESQTSIFLENNGSEIYYPTIDFFIKDETYMVSAIGQENIFQFGESLDASPLKEVEIKKEATEEGHYDRRKQTIIDKRWADLKTDSYNMAKINPNWRTKGSFSERGGTNATPTNGKIKIASWAKKWYTGEKMAEWVKGQTFDVAQTKDVNYSKSTKAYLLKRKGVYIGWLLEQDIDMGKNASTYGKTKDMVPSYGSDTNFTWHGPVMRYAITGDCTDFEASTSLNFYLRKGNEMGAFYFAVMSGDDVIGSILLSSHQNNMLTWLYFDGGGRGQQTSGYDKTIASSLWGRLKITRKGNQVGYEVYSDSKKKTFSRSYNIPTVEGLKPTHVLVWTGQYGNIKPVNEVSVVKLDFVGLDTKVWIKPKTSTVTETQNLPDPSTVLKIGDVVRLEMATNKAYVNGIESLTPIAYGSNNIGVPPGRHELRLECDTKTGRQPDVEVRYRECFR